MLTRRRFLKTAAQVGTGLVVAPAVLARGLVDQAPVLVNDIHSQLNPTYVRAVAKPTGLASLQETVRRAGGMPSASQADAMPWADSSLAPIPCCSIHAT